MSRIGKLPIAIPEKVKIENDKTSVKVTGAKGSLIVNLPACINFELAQGNALLSMNAERLEQDKAVTKSAFGLTRTLLANAVKGVSEGFSVGLELNGVGYRAAVSGKVLELALGYSHAIKFDIPTGIEIKVDKQTQIIVVGADKELVGRVSAKIRSFRPPEPYLGKGVKYVGEKIRRKAGKSGGK